MHKAYLIFSYMYDEEFSESFFYLSGSKAVCRFRSGCETGESETSYLTVARYPEKPELYNACMDWIDKYLADEENTVDFGGAESQYGQACRITEIEECDFEKLITDEKYAWTSELGDSGLNGKLRELKPYRLGDIPLILAYLFPEKQRPWLIRDYLDKKKIENNTIREHLISFLNTHVSDESVSPECKIFLGTYPSLLVKDEKIISRLNASAGEPSGENPEWEDFGYRSPNIDGGYVFFCDRTLGGKKYRGLYWRYERPFYTDDTVDPDSGNSIRKMNGFPTGNVFWFSYEPLLWTAYRDKDEVFLIADYVIDNMALNDDGFIRGLGNTVFTPDEKELLICGENGYIKIPSLGEIKRYLPKKEMRRHIATEYAMASGFGVNVEPFGYCYPFVWTKTPLDDDMFKDLYVVIAEDGSIADYPVTDYGYSHSTGGIRPVFSMSSETFSGLVKAEKAETESFLKEIAGRDAERRKAGAEISKAEH